MPRLDTHQHIFHSLYIDQGQETTFPRLFAAHYIHKFNFLFSNSITKLFFGGRTSVGFLTKVE